jgi:ribosome biogenesis GTPase A
MVGESKTRMTSERLGNGITAPAVALSDIDGAWRLLRLASLGEALGSNRVAEEARELATRVTEGRFFVACIAQFKRGKSTLINALIGEPILPVGFIPVTAVPTVVRFGEQRGARVRASDGSWREIDVADLKEYVSEERNPQNAKGIGGVEVFVPSPLLARGMCLVDTPGLGSVFMGNSEATRAFIPHVDAALIIVGADPPLAGQELELAEAVARQVQNLILVLNKADRASEEEKSAAIEFTRRVLEERLHRPVEKVFEVSATERLGNRGPGRDWRRLVEALEGLVEDSGRHIIRAAWERGLNRLSEQLLAMITEEREALERPIEQSRRRIAKMKETIADAERSMRELGFLFMAEQQHLSDTFVTRRKASLGSMLPQAIREFDEALRSVRPVMGPSYRRTLMRKAQEIARQHVLPWLQVEQGEAEKEYRQVAARFVQMGNDFLKRLADAGIPELARLPHALDPETGFRHRSEFTFRDLIEIAQPASPLRWLADGFLSAAGARRVIEKDCRGFLNYLLEVNSARVQSDVLNRVQESRSRLEVEIRNLLHEISRISEEALARARAARAAGAPAITVELARLNSVEEEVRDLAVLGLATAEKYG